MAVPTRRRQHSPQTIRSIAAMVASAHPGRNVAVPRVAAQVITVHGSVVHRTGLSNAEVITATLATNARAPVVACRRAPSIAEAMAVSKEKGVPVAIARVWVQQISTAVATTAVPAANAPAQAASLMRLWTAATGHFATRTKSAPETEGGVCRGTAWTAGLTLVTPE